MTLTKDSPTAWKKGDPNIPKGGRPKKFFDVKAELQAQLAEVDPDDAQGRSRGRVMVSKLIDCAIGKNSSNPSIRAVNEIHDRLLGKPPQALAIADLREENREQAIAGILDTLRVLKEIDEPTIQ